MPERDSLRIEEATKEDVPLILSFIRELAEYEKALDKVTATEEGLRVALFGTRPYAEAVIVYENLEPVAFAIYFFSFTSFSARPCLYLEDILVRPSLRGSGVGRKLLAFLAQRAIERECVRMEWAVLNWNETAINFYNRLGAVPVNDWTVFRLSDENLEHLANIQ